MAAIKALQQWCKIQCTGYRDVDIINMTTSFRDGLAFCALIHKFRPDLINFESLSKDNVYDNNCLAFRVAEDHLGIPALLDAEDMVALPVPDRLSILTYVSQYYNYFTGRSHVGGVGGVKRPAEDSKEEPSEKKNLPITAKTYSPKTHPVSSSVSSKAAQTRPLSHFIQTSSSNKHVSATPTQQCALSKNIKMASPGTDSPSTVKTPGRTAEQTVLVESSNKTGTLNSKCAVCRSHVHLVQRHLVDGKLYHRSCFKCCECSAALQSGAYTSGQQPGTLRCSSYGCSQKSLKSSAKHCGSDTIGLEPESGSGPSPQQHSSVLTSAVKTVPRSVQPTPAPEPWTASALRTQAARHRFFLSASEASTTQNIIVPKCEVEKERAQALISQKLAEGNCNNNNKAYGCGLSPDNKSVEVLSSEQETCGSGTEVKAEHFSISLTNTSSMESLWLSDINKEHTRPPSSSLFIARAKDVGSCEDPKLKTASNEPGLKTFAEDNGVTPEENKIICRDNQLSHQYTSSVPGFQTTNIVHLAELYTHKSPGTDSAVSGSKSESSSVSSSPRRTLPCTDQHHGGLAESSCISGNYKSCPSHQPLVDDSISLRPSAIQPRSSDFAEQAENGSVPFENSSQPETKPLTIKSRHIPIEQITKELQEIENSLSDLEKAGIDLERRLRICEEEGSGDILVDPLMVDWFNLIRKKQSYIRKESELMYIAKTQDLEEQQPGVEGELRRLIIKPEHLKSASERKRESDLMKKLVEIVNDRNAIVDGLEEDRRREEEEDQQLNEMMHRLDLRKVKSRRKSSFSKLFRRRSKNEGRKEE
ncbi:MICAL-like protein 2a [Pangasianodon hypophthalmus]|uniref:MICAL-like protein 2a n=1 Tax=Pangasianodon hypophthalmus TaxID=310915 RepID=UPI0023079F01|nr:MICAL-like protein 2a [Pangasianodon hypophthalmus]